MSRLLLAWIAICSLGFASPACGASPAAGQPSIEQSAPRQDDWYYPVEEPAERAKLKLPRLTAIAERQVSLAMPGDPSPTVVPLGGEFGGWRVVETLGQPTNMAVLERDFDRWGLIVFVDREHVAAQIRKAVGSWSRIQAPPGPFPADYFPRLRAANEDLLGSRLLRLATDPGYEDLSACLAPCEAYTFLGSPESPQKWIVERDGVIGVLPERWGSNKGLEKILFDPLGGTVGEGDRPTFAALRRKLGLLGGHLPAVNYGFFDAGRQTGWELCALVARGQPSSGFVRLRRAQGRADYYRLDPLRKLPDGKAFFAALLELHRSWERFFAAGMQLEIGDRRALDAARAGIVWALSGCVGPHPKYGMGGYWAKQHDGFPPTTLSLGTCLLDWGLLDEFKARQAYYLDHFVKADGTFHYYGPALAEYGQLLDLAAACLRRTGDAAWYLQHRSAIDRVVDRLLRLRAESCRSQSRDALTYGLLHGSAEADTADQKDYYLSGNVWCWRGLAETAGAWIELGRKLADARLRKRGEELLAQAKAFRVDILRAAERSVQPAGREKFLPPIVGLSSPPFARMTQDRLASYTNYRYWPEALSAACLSPKLERMILDYRTARGGELLAMTRFSGHLDDWPFYHQAYGLLAHDRVAPYVLGYYAHMAHHQMPGTFTAYEQVPIVGEGFRREVADYCVPSQLTVPILTRWMLAFEDRDAEVLWLCRAAPRAWFRQKLAVRGALTRWGRVNLEIIPADGLRRFRARIEIPADSRPIVNLRIRHPDRLRIADCRVTGGRCEKLEAEREWITLRPATRTVAVEAVFLP